MLNTIVTMEPSERSTKIFKSNLNVKYDFFSYYEYKVLPPNIKLIVEIINGKYDWIIFTSYRAWKFLCHQFSSLKLEIPQTIKIAVFGKESSKRIKSDGHIINFFTNVDNSKIFINELIKKININSKLVYFTSTAVNDLIVNKLKNSGIFIIRQDIYLPISTINKSRINLLFNKVIPDAIIFFSTNSAKLFMNTCTIKIIKDIQNMKLFTIGRETANFLHGYSNQEIIFPQKPDILKLSELIKFFAIGENLK